MPGRGKYTKYVPERNTKSLMLERLFLGTNKASPPYAGMEQAAAVLTSNAAGDVYLRGGESSLQRGDPATFGTVAMNYSGAPDTTTVTWNKPGDPAGPYVPDITSPGPGKVEGVDKTHAADAYEVKGIQKDLKPDWVPSSDTQSPSETSKKIHDNSSFKFSKMSYAKSGA